MVIMCISKPHLHGKNDHVGLIKEEDTWIEYSNGAYITLSPDPAI